MLCYELWCLLRKCAACVVSNSMVRDDEQFIRLGIICLIVNKYGSGLYLAGIYLFEAHNANIRTMYEIFSKAKMLPLLTLNK